MFMVVTSSSKCFPSKAVGHEHKKSQPRFPLGVAAGSFEAFFVLVLGLQHVTLTIRRPALPVGEEAVRKGEVIK
jgi:hypothetical protein